MFIALLTIVLMLVVVAAAYAGAVALGSHVAPVRFDPAYDTRRPSV
ncbi:hypothetical protein [Microbacterium sp. CPCC 204701]|nr:hypothetical protein [Microbacterium sp. CPCC 204701]